MKKIEEVQYLKTGAFSYLFGRYENRLWDSVGAEVIFTGSGRAALQTILKYYRETGRLPDKNSQILIPHWMCNSVVSSMQKQCFPTLTLNKNVRGLLVYHQYGFPQKMDEICDYCEENDLFIIEDCANVIESYLNGKHLGTFGDAAIFSISKFFPSLLGGALVTNNAELSAYAELTLNNCNRSVSLLTYGSRFLYECLKDTSFSGYSHFMQEMVYGIIDEAINIRDISLRVANEQLKNGAMIKRKENYCTIVDYFSETPECLWHLPKTTNAIPYVVPFFKAEKELKKIVTLMQKHNIVTGIYHFDVNRNLLNPRFEKCIWIPIHQGLNDSDMHKICTLVKGA